MPFFCAQRPHAVFPLWIKLSPFTRGFHSMSFFFSFSITSKECLLVVPFLLRPIPFFFHPPLFLDQTTISFLLVSCGKKYQPGRHRGSRAFFMQGSPFFSFWIEWSRVYTKACVFLPAFTTFPLSFRPSSPANCYVARGVFNHNFPGSLPVFGLAFRLAVLVTFLFSFFF